MKKIFLLIALFVAVQTYAQMYAEMAIGASDSRSGIVNAGLGFNYNNIIAQAEMVVLTSDNAPAYFGIRAGYNFIKGNFTVQPSVGRYLELYTTDKYDAYKNTMQWMYGLKIYYKKVFVRVQHADINNYSTGITLFF